MLAADLERLIGGGESYSLEFKRDINDSELTTNVVCLANGDGGLLLIGVDDDGAVIGARPRHGKATEPERLPALVANTTSPPVNVTASTVDVGGKTVIVIEVPKQTSLVSTTSGVYVRRALDVNGDAQCLPMQPHDAIARLASIGQRDLSAMPVPDATSDDLGEIEIGRFRESVRTIGDRTLAELSTEDLISALGFRTVDGDLVVGAVLMFGTEQALRRFVPTHEVAFQVLDQSSGVQANRIQRIPLVRAMTELSSAIAPFNLEEEVEHGLLRVGLPRYSDVAIRETIANALVHRNYGLVGQVRVAIENDVLSVTSPGAFPDGITIHNLLSVPPKPRNPLLADAFKRAGLVERTGRGINRVFAGQLELGGRRPITRDPQTTGSRSGCVLGRPIKSLPPSSQVSALATRGWSTCGSSRCSTRCARSVASPRTEQPRCSKFPSMRRVPNSTSWSSRDCWKQEVSERVARTTWLHRCTSNSENRPSTCEHAASTLSNMSK